MATQVGGGISIPITGDTTGLQAAVKDAVTKLQEMQAKHATLRSAVAEATKVLGEESAVTKKLANDLARTEDEFNRLTVAQTKFAKASDETAQSMKQASAGGEGFRQLADNLDNKLGKSAIVLGGVAQAAGTAGGKVQALVGGAADLALAFAQGVGPVAVATAAFGLMTKHIEEADAAAAKLEQRWKDMLAPLIDVRNAIEKNNAALRLQTQIALAQAAAPGANQAAIAAQLKGAHDLTEALKQRAAIQAQITAIEAAAFSQTERYKSAVAAGRSMTSSEVELATGDATIASAKATQELKAQLATLDVTIDLMKENVRLAEGAADAEEKKAAAAKEYAKALSDVEQRQTKMAAAFDKIRDSLRAASEAEIRAAAPFTVDTYRLLQAGENDLSKVGTANLGSSMMMGGGPLGVAAEQRARYQAGGVEDFNRGLSESVKRMEAWRTILTTSGNTLTKLGQDIGGAILQGRGGATAGQAIGSVAGSLAGAAIAPVLGMDPASGAAAGGGIGGALGSIMGGLLDKLVDKLGVLTPLFDALGTVVAALSPLFMVFREFFEAIGASLASIAPVVLIVARVLGAVALVFVRVWTLLWGFVPLMMAGLTGFMQVLDVLTIAVQWLDHYAMRPLISAFQQLINQLYAINNAMVNEIRKIPGFHEFGVIMEAFDFGASAVIEEFAGSIDELETGIDDNTNALQDQNQSLTNVPAGYKVEGGLFDAANPGRMGAGGMNVGTIVINTRNTAAQELDDMRRRNMRGTSGSLGRNTIREDRN